MAEIILTAREIPADLIEFFEPLENEKGDVFAVSTTPFSAAHFATFPPALITPCILAGTSERGCCPRCGAPWKRVVEKPDMNERPRRSNDSKMMGIDGKWAGANSAGQKYQEWRNQNPNVTTGWRPSCSCGLPDTVPAIILDPFMGAGTTGVVAKQFGRNWIGFELNPAYVEMARRRIDETQPALPMVAPEVTRIEQAPLF